MPNSKSRKGSLKQQRIIGKRLESRGHPYRPETIKEKTRRGNKPITYEEVRRSIDDRVMGTQRQQKIIRRRIENQGNPYRPGKLEGKTRLEKPWMTYEEVHAALEKRKKK